MFFLCKLSFFLKKIETHLQKHCDLLAYCLMPNHFHLLIATKVNLSDDLINKAIQTILSSYSQAINKQENRTGSLFQQHTKTKSLESNAIYAETCFHYIHQNPLRAGLVRDIENWEFSSVKDYAFLRSYTICNLAKARLLFDLPDDGSAFLKLSYGIILKENLDKIM
ncbi:transposase [Dyadobacter sp. CY345]|uniref:transposase n=1 Tax=Dyadobacter sp. CY345 TaxID=2909335 RepID=UPI00286E3B66|nr:transposase [Dyadobacter sp. CY345]